MSDRNKGFSGSWKFFLAGVAALLLSGAPARAASVFYRAFNLNGPELTIDGRRFEASSGKISVANQSGAISLPGLALNPATDSARAQMIRSFVWGRQGFRVSVSVPNGRYRVSLYVVEDNSSETIGLKVEGQQVLSQFQTGSAGRWTKVGPYPANVTDGRLTIETTGGAANLSGLEIDRDDAVVASCAGTGSITLQRWTGLPDDDSVPVETAPQDLSTVNAFEIPAEYADLYGSRLSGFVCVDQSGPYQFSVAADDRATLYLSTDESAANRRVIAEVPAWTYPREYTRYPEQRSISIQLVAGKRYFIEAVHREGAGGDHLSVALRLPSGAVENPLSGKRLSPNPAAKGPDSSTPSAGADTKEPTSGWEGPIVVTDSGPFLIENRNIRSDNMDVPAIEIATSKPVTIRNCHIAGNANLIWSPWSGARLTVVNNSFHGHAPNVDNRARGRAIELPAFRHLRVENNFFENTGTVVATDLYSGDGSANETLIVRYNRVRNIDGRYRNGYGRELSNFVAVQNYMHSQGNPRYAEIAWNDVINDPAMSSTEDLINFYQAGGRSDSWFKVHDNLLQGSYPNPATDGYATGSGIQIDGADHAKTAYIEAYNNTVMQTLNGAFGAAAGQHIRFHHNRAISSSRDHRTGLYWKGNFGGVWTFDHYGDKAVGEMLDIVITENLIGWASEGYTSPYPDRYDITGNLLGGIYNNQHWPNQPITAETEAAERALFYQKAQAAGVRFGPQ